MKHDMDTTADHRERLVVLEHSVGELSNGLKVLNAETKQSVSALSAEMRQSIGSLTAEVRNLFAEQAKAPKAHSFREMAITVGLTISIMTATLAGLKEYVKMLGAVDAFRLELVEKKLNPTIQYVKPVQ